MSEKRLGGFVDSVLQRHLKHEQDYSDALWTTAYAELLNAGFDADAILRWSRHGRRPSDELLQRKVDAAMAGNSALEPLSIDAYRRCFHILAEMMDFDELLDDLDSEGIDDPRMLAAVMFDSGLAIGY